MNTRHLKERLSLTAKFNILTISLILITSLGICFYIVQSEIKNDYKNLINHGRSIADMASKNCEYGIFTEDRESLLHVIESLSADPDIAYVSVMNQEKRQLISRVFKKLLQIPTLPFQDIEQISRIVHKDFVNRQDGQRYIEILIPVISVASADITDTFMKKDKFEDKPRVIGYLRLGLIPDNLKLRIQQLILSTSLFTSLIVLLGSGLTIFMTKKITQQLLREMTERKKSEERYALTSLGANDGLWDWNLKTDEIYFSPRWKSMLGYEQNEIKNNPSEWLSRVHYDDISRLRNDIDAHLKRLSPHLKNEHRMLHKDGTYRWMLCRGLAVQAEGGRFYRMAGSQTDITGRKLAEEQLLHDAFHDALTGLPNRALFMDRLAHVIALSKRHAEHSFAVLFLDIDRFKVINDSLGHLIGDQFLVALGQRLTLHLRPGDTVARLGGDEFAILLEDIGGENNTNLIVERLLKELSMPFNVAGHEIFTTASIGIAFSSIGYDEPEQILRDADTAMYQAKEQGRACCVVFERGMHVSAVKRLHLETDLRKAVERSEFMAYYQPILSLKTNSIIGFEALVRWKHPERGIIKPGDFVQTAEETGLIVAIDRLMLREACQQMCKWQAQFPDNLLGFISVNLSNKQVLQPDLVEYISTVLNKTGLKPDSLKLEITENVIIENPESTIAMLSQLRALGVQLYIDDFGTGYSSLSYLHRLPIDGLKIDRSFIRRMGEKGENQEIIKTIVMLAQDLNVDVIAEGIETENQLAQIKVLKCEHWQGHLFSKPVDSEQAKALIEVGPENIAFLTNLK